MVNGSETKTATPIIQTSALSGRPSQSAWLELNRCTRPSWCRKTFTTPFSGWSIQRKMSAVIITEAAHGAMIAHRANRLPGKRWLYSWARPSDITMVMATDAATQITVRTRMPGRFGFFSTWLKLLSPADPIVMPSGVMFWNDVWTIVTIGHRTTTAIRAIAGPIQSSGSRAASLRRQDDLAAPGRRAMPDPTGLSCRCWPSAGSRPGPAPGCR